MWIKCFSSLYQILQLVQLRYTLYQQAQNKIKYSETLMAALPKVQPFLPITLQVRTDDISFQQYESDEQTIQQQPRSLHPTLLNKSSIHCINISDQYLLSFPQIDKRAQRLDIYSNLLCQFPTGLNNLKQINISSNKINRFPSNLEDVLPCLRIIKANNNNIGIIPLLLQIRHLQLRQNPIKLITTRLSQSRLQYLDFDWIPYLINTIFHNVNPLKKINDQQQILYALYDLIEKASKAEAALFTNKNDSTKNTQTSTNVGIANEENQEKLGRVDYITTKGEFIGFDFLFQCSRNNGLTIQYLLHKAVNNNADFFIQFLRDWHAGINYNCMQYASKPILEQVLSLKYSKALQLFQIRKSNLSQPEIYMTNLLLSCRYINFDYFNYLTKNGLKRHIIQQNSPLIIQTILKSYDSQLGSDRMLKKILELANFNNDNKFTFALPYDYDFSEAECLAEAISDIMKDQQGLAQYFNFGTALEDQVHQKQNQFLAMMQRGKRQPLLHFAMKMRKPELVKKILQKFQKPFIKNFENKGARGIRGSMFSRKLVWKYEKKCIQKHFEENDVIYESPSKSKMRESRFLQFFYSKKQQPNIENNQKIRERQSQKIHRILQKKARKINLLQNHEKQDSSKAPEEIKSQQQKQDKPIINTATKQLKISSIISKCESPITYQSEQPILKLMNSHQKLDNLTLYESYHQSQLSLIMRDYDPVRQEIEKDKKFLSFYSPFHMCRDVDLQDDRDHQFYTVIQNLPENTQGAPLEKSRSGNSRMCMNACIENEMQINIMNSN